MLCRLTALEGNGRTWCISGFIELRRDGSVATCKRGLFWCWKPLATAGVLGEDGSCTCMLTFVSLMLSAMELESLGSAAAKHCAHTRHAWLGGKILLHPLVSQARTLPAACRSPGRTHPCTRMSGVCCTDGGTGAWKCWRATG